MKYRIRELKDGSIWNNFVKNFQITNILGSWEWICFERKLGYDVSSYGIYEGKQLVGVFAYRVIDARRGRYLFLRQNVFIDWDNQELLNCLVLFLTKKAKEHKCTFFRLAPPLLFSSKYENFLLGNGFQKAKIKSGDAQITNVLDLTQDSNDILKLMRKNTRYSIRKGNKLGVEVINTCGIEYLDEFENIYVETVQRHNWDAPDFDYIRQQYSFLASKGLSRMFIAKYEGEILAIAIFTGFNNQVIYHHSASVTRMNNVPAMYVLMWEAIEWFKKEGFQELNFFGVAPKDHPQHKWQGLSLFKRGFGGQDRDLMHSYDYAISFRYFFTKMFDLLLR